MLSLLSNTSHFYFYLLNTQAYFTLPSNLDRYHRTLYENALRNRLGHSYADINDYSGCHSVGIYVFTLVSYFSVRRIRHSSCGRIHNMVHNVSTKRLDSQVLIVLINFNRLHTLAFLALHLLRTRVSTFLFFIYLLRFHVHIIIHNRMISFRHLFLYRLPRFLSSLRLSL